MATKRKLVLALLITSVLLTLAVGLVAVWTSTCSSEIIAAIGELESKEAALPVAIQKLAAEVNRCPQADTYRVIWIAPDLSTNQTAMQRSLLYNRKSNALGVLGYEQDCFSGISETGYVIDDAAIRIVALNGGTLEDFKQYDQKTNRSR